MNRDPQPLRQHDWKHIAESFRNAVTCALSVTLLSVAVCFDHPLVAVIGMAAGYATSLGVVYYSVRTVRKSRAQDCT